jgi:putative ABC transport system ATP-binding protein
MPALVEINDVYKIYNAGDNEVRALDGVSLNINHGEFVAIIGQSGSGKSTLMNILGCLDTPTKGIYTLDGDAVANLSDNQLSEIRNKQIGFIFQGFNLIPALNALENVELPLIYRGLKLSERRKLATEALTRVGLANRRLHRPSELSGGQQQRAAIARAIAARPPIILADEPTGNLDTKSGLEVMNILKELNAEGKTIILITHDKSVATVAKRIVTLNDGKIISDVTNLPQQESAAGREDEKTLK